jgi:hypothetical protein
MQQTMLALPHELGLRTCSPCNQSRLLLLLLLCKTANWQVPLDPAKQGTGAEEFGEGDFADDVGEDGVGFPFESSDVGQDLDHLLANQERNWEHTRVGRALPPGWAKCPNMGSEVFCITPIKVLLSLVPKSSGSLFLWYRVEVWSCLISHER